MRDRDRWTPAAAFPIRTTRPDARRCGGRCRRLVVNSRALSKSGPNSLDQHSLALDPRTSLARRIRLDHETSNAGQNARHDADDGGHARALVPIAQTPPWPQRRPTLSSTSYAGLLRVTFQTPRAALIRERNPRQTDWRGQAAQSDRRHSTSAVIHTARNCIALIGGATARFSFLPLCLMR